MPSTDWTWNLLSCGQKRWMSVSYLAVWKAFSDRETFFLWPHNFIHVLCCRSFIIQHISSSKTAPLSRKQEGENDQRRLIFSTDQIPPAHGEAGLDGQWSAAVWLAVWVFQQCVFNFFILSKREDKAEDRHHVQAKCSTLKQVLWEWT